MTLLLSLLGKVRPWVWALIALLAWGWFNGQRAKSATEKLAQAKVAVVQRDAEETLVALREKERVVEAQAQAIVNASLQTQRSQADAAAARSVAERLRQRLAAAAASAASAPAASGGEAACAAGSVPADVYLRLVDRARGIAEAADTFRIAGSTCEAAYDGLTPKK